MNGYFSSAQEFVTKAQAKGYCWVAYQWNDGNLGPGQRAAAPAYRSACSGKLVWSVWLTRPFTAQEVRTAVVESQCEAIILEGEIPGDRPEAVDWVDVIFHLRDFDIPKAIVTNFAPFVSSEGQVMPEKARPLIEDGWACITENFVSESPNSTPENTHYFATQVLGWPTTQPMIEGWHIADYGDLSRFSGVSHWDAGNVL